ncbi:MAG: fumarylacetoacetate hydrolase family protein [Candidatus Rokuibacteriota bacterium]
MARLARLEERTRESYKLLSYRAGRDARAGLLVADRVYDAARLTRTPAYASVLHLLEDWSQAKRALAQAAKAIASGKIRATEVVLARTRLLAPVLYPGAIFCAGANYTDRGLEMARAQNAPPPPDPHQVGLAPWHFIKTSRGSVVGPGARVTLPAYSQKVDWEVEAGRGDRPSGKGRDDRAGARLLDHAGQRDRRPPEARHELWGAPDRGPPPAHR